MSYLYLRNMTSGKVHRLLVDESGKARPLEQCNSDQIEHKAWLTQEEAEAAPHCGHCWPEPGE